ncbi:MAG: EpsG family protein [Cruoricaptor ignavus]|nr:EpsG family protein [Cruoricaptor ignavus]
MLAYHPFFTIVFVALIAYSFLEVYSDEYRNFKSVWAIIGVLIILAGLRSWVGADYGEYVKMYRYFGQYTDYSEVFNKALFRETKLEIEWIWVLLGKIFFFFGSPFHYFALLIAIISITTKYWAFEESVVYPALSMALYMFPSFFSGDMGQMRQAAAMGILLLSFVFIKNRNLPMFLLMVYLAMGFHKSSFVFILAYWIATIKLTPSRMLMILLLCMALSPFQIYNYIGIFEMLAPGDVYSGFSDYATIENENASGITFTDLLVIMYMFFMLTFDKQACEKIPYYEYMRNIGFVGMCIFYIFRMSPIFSGRLTAIYLVYMVMVLPNILAAISNIQYRRYLHLVLVCFVVMYYFIYLNKFAYRAGFTIDTYRNHLLTW